MNYRNLRVAKLIENELSRILAKEMEFDGALVTITGVEVHQDLSRAKVKLGVIPPDKAAAVLKEVKRRAAQLRFLLLKKLNIKPVPQLIFEIDRGAEAAADFDKALLKSKNK